MKFFNLLLVALCVSCVLSTSLMRKEKRNKSKLGTSLKFSVFGDIGQIDEFSEKIFNDKKIGEILSKPVNEHMKEVEQLCVYDDKPIKDNESACQKKPIGSQPANNKLTMSNFNTIKKLLEEEQNVDANFLLGDALYTEAKNMAPYLDFGLKDSFIKTVENYNSFNNALKKVNQSKADLLLFFNGVIDTSNFDQIKKQLDLNDEDFTEVRNDLLKDQKEKTTTQQQLMYKIEQGTKKKLEKTGNDMISKIFDRKVVERIQLEFNKRQGCAWFNIDKEQINTLNKVSTPQDEGKLYISYGNHAFDWNYDFETLMMTKYNPWKLNTVLKIQDAK